MDKWSLGIGRSPVRRKITKRRYFNSGTLFAGGGVGTVFKNARMSAKSVSEATFEVYGGIWPVGWRTYAMK